jgi:hypothetical protein
MEMNTNPSTIAGAIQVEADDKVREILKPGVVPRKNRIAIIKWILGGVATHQRTCLICNAELSRAHAIRCADIEHTLLPKYGRILNPNSTINMLDQLINFYRNENNPAAFNDIYFCIVQIYNRCLGFRQQANGHFQEQAQRRLDPARAAQAEPIHVVNGWNRRRQREAEQAEPIHVVIGWNRRRQREAEEESPRRQRPRYVVAVNEQVIPRRRDQEEAELENNRGEQGQRWRPP